MRLPSVKKNEKLAALVLLFVFVLNMGAVLLLSGCSYRHKPRGYVCIEKPPIKTTYVDFDKDITPETVRMMMNETHRFTYRDMKLNERNEITVNYSGSVQHGTTDITEFSVGE